MREDLHHELSQHAAGLRGLARDLLRDPHAADDVVQATMQQALAHRQLRSGPLGGWLHRTLVNFVHQWRRGERRRTAREAALPIPEPAPAMADQLVRREQLRAVTEAVLRLDEPYQTTVFLRYFEDLPPRAIARATGTNVATVKSRLARGLVMLRARLDQHGKRGDWRPALAVAFGLPPTTLLPLLPLHLTTIAMSATTKILLTAGVACVGGIWWLGRGDAPAPVTPAVQADARADAPIGATAAAASERQEVAPPSTPAATVQADWLLHAYPFVLDVRVIDTLGMPVPDHTVRMAPIGCTRNMTMVPTDADGRTTVQWHGRQPQMTLEIEDPRGQSQRLSVSSDSRASLVLLTDPPAAGQRVQLALSRDPTQPGATEQPLVLDALPIVGRLFSSEQVPHLEQGLHPHPLFGDRCARAEVPAPQSVELSLGSMRFSSFTLAFEADQPAANAAAGARPAIAGIVIDSDGKPCQQVAVVLLGTDARALQRTQTDNEGRFRFEQLEPGQFTVRAGGDRQGLATLTVPATTGTTPATLQLQTGSCVRGRATTPAGAAIADAIVEWRSLDGSHRDATTTDKTGTFVLANLPGGPGSVQLLPPDGARRQVLATAPSVLPDSGELLLTADPSGGCRLQLEPIVEPGGAEPVLRVWHSETRLGTRIRAPEHGAVWSLTHLPAGFYDLAVTVPGHGHRELGRHWLDGTNDVDLGRLELPRGGTVRFAIADGALPGDVGQRQLELVALRADADVRVDPMPSLEAPVQLPAGDYALLFRHADGSLRAQRFSVRSDAETEVELLR